MTSWLLSASDLSRLAAVTLVFHSTMTRGPGALNSRHPRPPLELHSSIPQIQNCRQLITVTTNSWNDKSATIRVFERGPDQPRSWKEVEKPFPGVIGRRGFGWGIGLHGTGEPGAPRKREGDQRSPAGVFKLFSVFGLARPAQMTFLRLPYQQVTAGTEAIDDPRSRYYNRIVDRSRIAHPDWSSSESMLRVGGRYRFGLMIQHNWQAAPEFGSCIFFHVWDNDQAGTAGCTATSSAHLERLLHWLNSEKNPLIVQLPQPEYLRLRESWGLP
jgi:L,D-peptidoglycan transpeptidase YkuD (ErfK/YbiS/YcfS/YnhG family)